MCWYVVPFVTCNQCGDEEKEAAYVRQCKEKFEEGGISASAKCATRPRVEVDAD